jgi:M6 family metalloprotease-like protein
MSIRRSISALSASVALSACALDASAPDPSTDPTLAAEEATELGATTDSLLSTGVFVSGHVVVVAPPEAAPVTSPAGTGWSGIPGLAGAVNTVGATSNLALTLSAEMFGTHGVRVRALVDGVPADPEYVDFKSDNAGFDEVRSFTFVKANVPPGQHVVDLQWQTTNGQATQIRDRSLVIESGATANFPARMSVASAKGLVVTTSTTGVDLPGLATTAVAPNGGSFQVTFSADLSASNGKAYAQIVVDGVVQREVVVAEQTTGLSLGARRYTFAVPATRVGQPTDVRVRYRVDPGASVWVRERSLAVSANLWSSDAGGSVIDDFDRNPSLITSTSYSDFQTLGFTTVGPSSTVAIDASAQARVEGGRLFLRALVDGKATQPSNVTFVQADPMFRANSFVFTFENLPAGNHQVQLQTAVDQGARAFIADRSLRVANAPREGASFVRPFKGLRPAQRTFRTAVICFDPVRPGHARPSLEQLRNMFEGNDGGQSVRGWYDENSDGRTILGQVLYLGCGDNAWYTAPAAHQGNWYWDHGAYELMWQEAIRAADADFDFHAYDTNHDGRITPDELLVSVVRPQSNPYGTIRSTSVAVDGNSTALKFTVADLYISSLSYARRENVGLTSHEFSHAVLGTQDLYSSCPAEYDPGYYSIMAAHWQATHLDPMNKLKSGFVAANAIAMPSWGNVTYAMPSVELSYEVTVLYDPARGDHEYFVVENRMGSAAGVPNYDSPLGNSVVIWQVIEDQSIADSYPPSTPGCTGGRIPIRKLAVLSTPESSYDLKWADGTSARFRVTLHGSPGGSTIPAGDRTNVQLQRLPLIIRPPIFELPTRPIATLEP